MSNKKRLRCKVILVPKIKKSTGRGGKITHHKKRKMVCFDKKGRFISVKKYRELKKKEK